MEVTVQSNKPATTQDAVLGLVSSSRNQDDGERFDKVFEEASQKLKSDDHNSSKRAEEDEEKVKKENKPVQKKVNELESTEGLAGLVRTTEIQKKAVEKIVRADPNQKQQVQNGEKNKPLLKQKKVKEDTAASETAKAEASLKKQRVRTAAQKRVRANEHKELVKGDRVKGEQIRELNGPFKPQQISQSNVSSTLTKSLPSEYHAKDGTQIAQDQGNMLMPTKQNAPKPEGRPVLVDELRPATGAETASKSTNHQGQQDLSREPAKEQVLPVTPIQNLTPSTNGISSTQAMAPNGGSIVSPMLEKIWDAVTTFRIRGENEMVVKVQPDNNTEMQLTIKYGAGGVEIEARMHQGDGRQLASGWNELQQQLSERGVNLGELVSDSSERGANDSDPRQFNRHAQQNYEVPEFQVRDDEADWAALGMAATREQEKTKSAKQSTDKVEEAYDGWQSWA